MLEGRGGKKHTPPLGLEVITVLCTQNNWSHQCGCHTECLALPCHRCSPLYGQKKPQSNPNQWPRISLYPLRYPNALSDSTFTHQSKLSSRVGGNKDGQDVQRPETHTHSDSL